MVNGKAEIPNFLLQDTYAVTVYAYSGSAENGYTMAEKTFDVVKKPKPADYVGTKEDQATLAKLKAEIGDLSALQTTSNNNLVSAINEAATSGGSGTSEDAVELLAVSGIVQPVSDANGKLYADENGKLFVI